MRDIWSSSNCIVFLSKTLTTCFESSNAQSYHQKKCSMQSIRKHTTRAINAHYTRRTQAWYILYIMSVHYRDIANSGSRILCGPSLSAGRRWAWPTYRECPPPLSLSSFAPAEGVRNVFFCPAAALSALLCSGLRGGAVFCRSPYHKTSRRKALWTEKHRSDCSL